MSLDECIESHTNRQYLAWLAWLDKQWNEPSRTDYYLMRVAQTVTRIYHWLTRDNSLITLTQFVIPFHTKPAEDEHEETVEEATAHSQAAWFAMTGYKPPKDNSDG